MTPSEVAVRLGAMCDKVSDQLIKAGHIEKKVGQFAVYDKDAEALVRMHVRGLVPDAEIQKARRRLVGKIAKELSAP